VIGSCSRAEIAAAWRASAATSPPVASASGRSSKISARISASANAVSSRSCPTARASGPSAGFRDPPGERRHHQLLPDRGGRSADAGGCRDTRGLGTAATRTGGARLPPRRYRRRPADSRTRRPHRVRRAGPPRAGPGSLPTTPTLRSRKAASQGRTMAAWPATCCGRSSTAPRCP